MTQKIKVIELTGAKLDPDATYLFVFNTLMITSKGVHGAIKELDRLGVRNGVYCGVKGPVDQGIKVYEIPKAKTNGKPKQV